MRPQLHKQITWTLAGNLVYAACQWGMLVVLAKTVPPAMVGQFGLGLAISAPIFMFANLQLRSIQATDLAKQVEFRDYLGYRLVSTVVAVLAIIGIAVGADYGLSPTRVILAVGIAKGVEAIADTIYGHLQSVEMMNRIAVSMAIKGVMSLLFLSVVMPLTRSVLAGAIAMGIASLVVLLVVDLPNALAASAAKNRLRTAEPRASGIQSVRPRLRTASLLLISKLGLPLGIASLLLGLATTIPRYLLERFHGQEALGYFTALSHPTAAFPILLSAFGQAATPRMAAHYKSDRGEFWRLVVILSAVPIAALAGVVPLLLSFGPKLLSWIYRPEYAAHYSEFLRLIAAGAIWSMASVMGYAATSSGRLTSQAPVSGLVCVVTLVTGGLLIPGGGLAGAADTAMISGVSALVAYSALFLPWRNRATIPQSP